MPCWDGYDEHSCPKWYGKDGKLIEASVEPGGLHFYAELPQDEWDTWFNEFKERATILLGYEVGEPEEGFVFPSSLPKVKKKNRQQNTSKNSFINKHPYLFWQLMGLALFLIDFIYFSLNLDNENISYPFVVFTGLGGSMAIILSPLFIKLSKRKASTGKSKTIGELNSYIINTYAKNHIYKCSLLFILAFVVTIFTMGGLIYIGLTFIIPAAFYLPVLMYILWKDYVIKKFYKIKDADGCCEIIKVQDLSFLDKLYDESAITFFREPEPLILDFLYNLLNNQNLLKIRALRIYSLTYKDVGEKFDIDFGVDFNINTKNTKKRLICILPDDLNFENKIKTTMAIKLDFKIGGNFFDDFVDIYSHNRICSGMCPICGDDRGGLLWFITELDTENVFLACDSCGTCYDSPENFANGITSETEYRKSRISVLEEVKVAGWDEYIEGSEWQ